MENEYLAFMFDSARKPYRVFSSKINYSSEIGQDGYHNIIKIIISTLFTNLFVVGVFILYLKNWPLDRSLPDIPESCLKPKEKFLMIEVFHE
ncbi:hypothetical protein MXB_1223 [Myxobolus squamalis]|nr:hypothetical protein MXB_1223 [Myxobolus squamalis]